MIRLNHGVVHPQWDDLFAVGRIVPLKPWIPYVADGPEAFCTVERICLAPTVEQCFIGISQWGVKHYEHVEKLSGPAYDDEFWWVLKPTGQPKLYPAPNIVEDADETNEHWILEQWDFEVIAKIQMFWRALTDEDPLEWTVIEGEV